jgi:hypothetical protein
MLLAFSYHPNLGSIFICVIDLSLHALSEVPLMGFDGYESANVLAGVHVNK